MAVALRPALLLLDEPTAGMSPEETFRTGELVKRLNASGMTIIVIDEGSLERIISNEDVVRIYLGKV